MPPILARLQGLDGKIPQSRVFPVAEDTEGQVALTASTGLRLRYDRGLVGFGPALAQEGNGPSVGLWHGCCISASVVMSAVGRLKGVRGSHASSAALGVSSFEVEDRSSSSHSYQ